MPAALADSALVTRELLAIARNADRSREIRRSALSWVVRRRGEVGELSADEVSRTLVTIARDENEVRTVRDQALSSLARLETQSSLDALVSMTTGTTEAWLSRRAVEMMASSGDPRAHDHLRSAAERTDLTEEARVAAINGLAGSYATSKDAEYLRGLYARVSSDRLRDAIMSGVATIGGKASRDWIVGIARDPNAPIQQRKRAVSLADRMGLSATELSFAVRHDRRTTRSARSLISQLAIERHAGRDGQAGVDREERSAGFEPAACDPGVRPFRRPAGEGSVEGPGGDRPGLNEARQHGAGRCWFTTLPLRRKEERSEHFTAELAA